MTGLREEKENLARSSYLGLRLYSHDTQRHGAPGEAIEHITDQLLSALPADPVPVVRDGVGKNIRECSSEVVVIGA